VKAGQKINTNWRFLGPVAAPVQGSTDITALYVGKFGAPAAGQRVLIRCWVSQSGFSGVPRVYSAIVPALAG